MLLRHDLEIGDRKMSCGNIVENKFLRDESAGAGFTEMKLQSYKMLTNDPVAKCRYLIKPSFFIVVGAGLICVGCVLTASHFIYEDSLADNHNRDPYFTYGPIAVASGLFVFMIGLVWFSVKRQKWAKGTASPIAKAMAVVGHLAASATLTSEQIGMASKN